MKRRRLNMGRETVRVLAGVELVHARGGQVDQSFVYACTAPWSAGTTCDPSNPYVCAMGPGQG